MLSFKDISELFTVALPALILCSCIYLITYYHYWHIPVIDYLSSSEILLSFIEPGLVILGLAAIYFGGSLLFSGIILLLLQWNIIKQKETKEKPEANTGNKEKSFSSRVASILYTLFVAVIMVYFFVIGIWYEYDIFPVVIFHVLLWVIAISVITKFIRKKKVTSTVNAFFWGTLITLISASFFYGRYQMNATSLHPIPYTLFLTDSTSIVTNNKLIYLGKTNNYFFLYDSAARQSVIIPSAEVKQVRIKH